MRTDGRGGRTQRGPNICELGPSPPSCAYTPERGQSRWSAWRPSGWPMGAVTFRAGPRCPPRSCAAPCDSLAQAGGGGEGKGRVEGAPDPQHTERGRREGGKGEEEGRKGGDYGKGSRATRGPGKVRAAPGLSPGGTHARIYIHVPLLPIHGPTCRVRRAVRHAVEGHAIQVRHCACDTHVARQSPHVAFRAQEPTM